jgi:hypothetical protein
LPVFTQSSNWRRSSLACAGARSAAGDLESRAYGGRERDLDPSAVLRRQRWGRPSIDGTYAHPAFTILGLGFVANHLDVVPVWINDEAAW